MAAADEPGHPSLPASLLTRVQALPGVAQAAGAIADSAQLVGHDGKVISRGGAPGLAFTYSPEPQRFSPLQPGERQLADSPGEVDIDAATASKQHFSIGQQIGVVGRGPVQQLPHRRHGQVRGRVLAGRRHDGALPAGHRPAALPQAGAV